MSEKKAFIFDTNFIIQNKRLDIVVENLKNDYEVYVTQVSIDERIAQRCRETKEKFDAVEECAKKYSDIVKITMKKTLEEECASYKVLTPKAYTKIFGKNIIPYKKTSAMFELVIERANKKEPPFSRNKDASDKGFKDCLLWLSILEYFKNNGESHIIFLTDDKSAFKNNFDFLTKEFNDITGKTIEFKPNSYYDELISPSEKTSDNPPKEEITNISQIRNKISETIYNLCRYEEDNGWGDISWEKYFKISTFSNPTYAKTILESLPGIIDSHIFERRISSYDIFNIDGRVQLGALSIPIEFVEAAHYLHKEIKEKYPSYLDQFYLTVSNILNSNYDYSQIEEYVEDDSFPF